MADPGDSLMPEDPPVPPDSLRTAATLMRRVERATGGRGACVGRPMLLGEPEPHAGRGHAPEPVVALLPAAMGYAEAAGRLRSLVADGVNVGAVLVSTDEGVLVANRTGGDPPAGRPVQRGGGARSRPPPGRPGAERCMDRGRRRPTGVRRRQQDACRPPRRLDGGLLGIEVLVEGQFWTHGSPLDDIFDAVAKRPRRRSSTRRAAPTR
jgi:hypothetical protein